MKVTDLIALAEQRVIMYGGEVDQFRGFGEGGRWMGWLMGKTSVPTKEFIRWGTIKYTLSVLAGLTILFISGEASSFALIMAAFAFYLVEVHFLFLFPLIIDREAPLLRVSVRATYRVGLWRALSTTISIAAYMIEGLFKFQKPLYQWYVGCACIVVWYEEEIRDRI